MDLRWRGNDAKKRRGTLAGATHVALVWYEIAIAATMATALAIVRRKGGRAMFHTVVILVAGCVPGMLATVIAMHLGRCN